MLWFCEELICLCTLHRDNRNFAEGWRAAKIVATTGEGNSQDSTPTITNSNIITARPRRNKRRRKDDDESVVRMLNLIVPIDYFLYSCIGMCCLRCIWYCCARTGDNGLCFGEEIDPRRKNGLAEVSRSAWSCWPNFQLSKSRSPLCTVPMETMVFFRSMTDIESSKVKRSCLHRDKHTFIGLVLQSCLCRDRDRIWNSYWRRFEPAGSLW